MALKGTTGERWLFCVCRTQKKDGLGLGRLAIGRWDGGRVSLIVMLQLVTGQCLADLGLEVQADGLRKIHVQVDMHAVLMVRLVFVVVGGIRDVAGDDLLIALVIMMVIVMRVVMQVFVIDRLPVGVLLVRHLCSCHGSEHHGVIQNQQQGDEDFQGHRVDLGLVVFATLVAATVAPGCCGGQRDGSFCHAQHLLKIARLDWSPELSLPGRFWAAILVLTL